jgi:hypothetical protein
MNNSGFNIITPTEYYKNINSYQYNDIIEVKEKKYSEFIYKDLLKEFYCNLIDNDVELKEEVIINDDLVDKSSEYAYLIIDRDDIELFCKQYNLFITFLMELVYFLDIGEAEKFNIIYSIVNYVGVDFNEKNKSFTSIDYIIKLKRVPRNLLTNPIFEEDIEELMIWIEDYNYDNLSFNF